MSPARWRRASSSSTSAQRCSGKPPTPAPIAGTASVAQPRSRASASAARSALRTLASLALSARRHAGGVDHEARGQLSGAGHRRLADRDRADAVALGLDARAALARGSRRPRPSRARAALFAAFTIASTACSVMSPSTSVMRRFTAPSRMRGVKGSGERKVKKNGRLEVEMLPRGTARRQRARSPPGGRRESYAAAAGQLDLRAEISVAPNPGGTMAEVLEVTDQNFEEMVIKSKTPAIIDFWAEWCAPCRPIAPIIKDLAARYGDKVKIVKMNIDENPGTPGTYGVRAIPTVLAFRSGSRRRADHGREAAEVVRGDGREAPRLALAPGSRSRRARAGCGACGRGGGARLRVLARRCARLVMAEAPWGRRRPIRPASHGSLASFPGSVGAPVRLRAVNSLV